MITESATSTSSLHDDGRAAIAAAERIEQVLRYRVRVVARTSRHDLNGPGSGQVAGAPISWWRGAISGWLSEELLQREVGGSALLGARQAIDDFADEDLTILIEELAGD